MQGGRQGLAEAGLSGAVDVATVREVRRLLESGVPVLHPEETVLQTSLTCWSMQMEARNLTPQWIDASVGYVRRFIEFSNEYPWSWTAGDLEEWSVHLLSELGRSAQYIRNLQNTIGRYLGYLRDPAYDWAAVCEHYFGTVPAQIRTEFNTILHTQEDTRQPGNRALTRGELASLFDYADDRVRRAVKLHRKGAVAAARDAAMLKTQYAWGLRRREVCMLERADVRANGRQPQFGQAGLLEVRWGKGHRGSGPRRRTVLSVMPWASAVLEQYLAQVRSLYRPGPELWVSERSRRIGCTSYNDRFAEYRQACGLPAELNNHCLRHSYATHL